MARFQIPFSVLQTMKFAIGKFHNTQNQEQQQSQEQKTTQEQQKTQEEQLKQEQQQKTGMFIFSSKAHLLRGDHAVNVSVQSSRLIG